MADALQKADETPSKKQLQRQMEQTRESVAETVSEIKETVNEQVAVARKTVAGVLDYREEFAKEPLVWGLGALSAGFALGYTMGYAHKETKGARKKSEVAAFADSIVQELSVVGNHVVMPTLNARIKELFGFDFSHALNSINEAHKSPKRSTKARARRQPRKTKSRKTRA